VKRIILIGLGAIVAYKLLNASGPHALGSPLVLDGALLALFIWAALRYGARTKASRRRLIILGVIGASICIFNQGVLPALVLFVILGYGFKRIFSKPKPASPPQS
jgi:hypothetical protein